MPILVATRTVRYAGKDQKVGDQFEASEKDARVLIAIKKARLDTGSLPNASDLPVEVMSRTAVEERWFSKATEAVEEDEAPKQKRAYRRRDMTAGQTGAFRPSES